MNSFTKLIQYYGLNSDSQGENGFIHALFAYAESDYEGADTFSNPAKEILRRLEARGVNQHVLTKVAAFVNEYSNKVDAGRAV